MRPAIEFGVVQPSYSMHVTKKLTWLLSTQRCGIPASTKCYHVIYHINVMVLYKFDPVIGYLLVGWLAADRNLGRPRGLRQLLAVRNQRFWNYTL